MSFQWKKIAVAAIMVVYPLATHAGKSNMYNTRYCEIILSKSKMVLEVYNTIGLNNCPSNSWKKITVAQIKKETGSSFVYLNGPRFFLMDEVKDASSANRQQKVFGDLNMREAGVLHISMSDIVKGDEPYNEHAVERHNTWVYNAGRPVYELIDPKGRIFVMQSYSVQAKSQNIASLSTLDRQLKLPKGWSFRTGTINKTMELAAANNKAIVVQDSFMNTYQLASKDFLKD